MSLISMMNQTVTIKPVSTYNDYGEETHGTAVSHSARVSYGEKYVMSLEGNMFKTIARVYLEGDVTVEPNSFVTLPDSSTPYKCQVYKVADKNGNIKYTKLFIGAESSAI